MLSNLVRFGIKFIRDPLALPQFITKFRYFDLRLGLGKPQPTKVPKLFHTVFFVLFLNFDLCLYEKWWHNLSLIFSLQNLSFESASNDWSSLLKRRIGLSSGEQTREDAQTQPSSSFSGISELPRASLSLQFLIFSPGHLQSCKMSLFLHRSFLSNQIYPKKKRVNRDRFFTFNVLNGHKKQI